MARGNSVKIRIDGDASDFEKKLSNIGKTAKAGMADVKAGIDLATSAMEKLADVAQKGIGYNATIEQLKTSFEVMTGSAEKAAEVVERLRIMGAETPFEMKDLASTTQLLMQYGFSADEALDRMRMLGDVAQGNKEAMNSIALGYAQMSSAGKVNLVDIKQMINGGFNPLQEISERTGESMASLYDRISKGTMTVDEITESMRRATSEGGRFYQSMEKQSQTLNGQLSTLKDNADQLLGSLTEGIPEGLRDQMLPFANNLVAELQKAFETGGYQGLVDTATDMIPDLLGMMTGGLQEGIAGLTRWLPQGASKLMQALPTSFRAGNAVIPQITNALFEVASVVISDLVAMLPELVPTLLEGLSDTFVSVLKGMDSLVEGLVNGVEQAFHKGQTKIAGIWVDDTAIAKYTFDLTTDTEPAVSAVEEAYRDIREALTTDLLTEDQKQEVLSMIGESYDDIKAKLMSFGLSETEAEKIASQITTAGDTIKAKIDSLNLGVDSSTVLKWIAQAEGSSIRLKSALKRTGLTPEQQQEVVDVFTEMNDNINGQLPDVVSDIYNTLTNGILADDDAKSLKDKLDEAFSADIAEVESWLQGKLGELDTESETYSADVAALSEEAALYKAEISTLHDQMVALVDSLAGQPTHIVEARMAEFAEIEARLAEINSYIDDTTAKARSAEEAAYQVVRSGAQADEATISQAISFKVKEFRLDEQSAEDAYNAAIQELNMQLANGEIGQTQYDARVKTETSKLEDAKKAAREAFENAMREIFTGIAESEGIDAAFEEAGKKLEFSNYLQEILKSFDELETGLIGDKLGDFTTILAEYLQIDPEILKATPIDTVKSYIEDWALTTFTESAAIIEGLDNTKLQEAYSAALQDGLFTDTVFDTESQGEQLTNLITAVFDSASENAAKNANASVTQVAESATKVAETILEDGGESAGGYMDAGIARGISDGRSKVISAVTRVATDAIRTFKNLLGIQSPSKVMMELGQFTGEGYAIGLENSMRNAVAIAKRMSGQIVTAADITQTMRVSNMPNLQAEIASANANAPTTPVYLDGVQIAEIQGHNNSTQIAWNNTRAAKGVGSR